MSYYASNLYASQYYRSQYYAGTGQVLTGRYFDRLGQLGFLGTLDDRQKQYLQSQGVQGGMNDCMKQHLENIGYPVQGVQQKLKAKSVAEGMDSVSQMMRQQGLIPL